MAFKPTKEQQSVIEDKAPTLVVSASAGSGKTSTMIKRILRIIESGVKLPEILVLTFTNAAAADMRQKLYEELSLRAAENKNFFDALFSVGIAKICTIDSFCKQIVNEFFYIAKVEPSFKIIDNSFGSLIKERACKNVLNKFFKKGDSEFFEFLKNNFEKRDTSQIKNLIYKVFAFLQASGNRHRLEELTKNSHNENLNENSAALFMLEFSKNELSEAMCEIDTFCKSSVCGDVKNYCIRLKEKILSLLAAQNFEDFFAKLKAFQFERIDVIKAAKDSPEKEERDLLKALLKDSAAQNIKKMFNEESIGDIKKLLALSYKNSGFLLKLTSAFEEEFSKLKKEKNMLDFADTEALCLEVLQNKEAQSEICAKYKHIFVDEFQDINGIQNAILNCLPHCVFVVGDVKQSIYGFRLTSPKIFAKRLCDAKQNQKDKKAFNLSANFRSTREILEFNNFVFKAAMKNENCGIDYENEGMFSVDNSMQHSGEMCEVFIVKKEEKEREELPQVYSVANDMREFEDAPYAKMEAQVAGNIICELREKGIKDGEITILCRAKNDYVREICKNLTSLGFNLNVNFNDDLTKSLEVSFIHSFLNLVNNFKNDIDLISVMLSPLFNFTPDELFEIRNKLPDEKFFYNCVLSFCGSETIENKIDLLIQKTSEVYEFSKNHNVFETAQHTIIMFNYFTAVNKMGADESVVKNYLEVLKNSLVGTLSEYVSLTQNAALTGKAEQFQTGDRINVTTIHSSKGLEYKAVILVGAGGQFNLSELKSSAFITGSLGIATNCANADEDEKKTTIAKNASKILKQREMLAEEIRVLYVALTRAKNKLYIIASTPEKTFKQKPRLNKFSSIIEIVFSALSMPQKEKLFCKEKLSIGNFCKFESLNLSDAKQSEMLNAYILPRAKNENLKKEFEACLTQTAAKKPLVVSKTTVTRIADNINEKQTFSSFAFDDEEKERRILEGNAYHKLFESFNFETEKFACPIPMEVDKKYVDAFLNSPLIKLVKGKKVLKEQKFVLRLENGSLMQGIIDLIAINDEGFILVDYKTTNASESEIKKRYKPQIMLYAQAAQQILKIKYKNLYIYSIKSGKLVGILE